MPDSKKSLYNNLPYYTLARQMVQQLYREHKQHKQSSKLTNPFPVSDVLFLEQFPYMNNFCRVFCHFPFIMCAVTVCVGKMPISFSVLDSQ